MRRPFVRSTLFTCTALVAGCSEGRGSGIEACGETAGTDIPVTFSEAKIISEIGAPTFSDNNAYNIHEPGSDMEGDYIDKVGEIACFNGDGDLVLTVGGAVIVAIQNSQGK